MKTSAKRAWISWALVFLCFIIVCLWMARAYPLQLTSDASAELLISRFLADEGKLLSENFYYSTELRVVDSNLVFAPLFGLFSGWRTVRILGTVLLHVLMLASLVFLCRAAGLEKAAPLFVLFWLLPFSKMLLHNVLLFAYYDPVHIPLCLGLGLSLLAGEEGRRGRVALLLSLPVAFLAGLNGMRAAVAIYLPLLAALAAVRLLNPARELARQKRCLTASAAALLAAVCGYGINSLFLARRYHFASYDRLSFVPFSFGRLELALDAWLECLGYQEGPVFSFSFVYCAMAGALALLSLFAVLTVLRRREAYSLSAQMLTLFYAASLLLMLLIFSLSNMPFNNRYLLTTAALVLFPLYLCFANDAVFPKGKRLLALLLALCLLSSALQMRTALRHDQTASRREAAAFLAAEGYHEGYATFWNASVLTEFSDGAIEVWAWPDGRVEGPDRVYEWLQPVSHSLTRPAGKCFVLLDSHEAKKARKDCPGLRDEDLIFQSEAGEGAPCLVWGYDSPEELAAAFAVDS